MELLSFRALTRFIAPAWKAPPYLALPPLHGDPFVSTLTFSQYPLRPAIIIEADTDSATLSLCVAVLAINREKKIPFPTLIDETPDHIVHKHCWYPLVPGSLDEVRQTLKEAEVSALGPITLRQYLRLRSLASEHATIIDQSGDAASALQQKASVDLKTAPSFVGTLFPVPEGRSAMAGHNHVAGDRRHPC